VLHVRPSHQPAARPRAVAPRPHTHTAAAAEPRGAGGAHLQRRLDTAEGDGEASVKVADTDMVFEDTYYYVWLRVIVKVIPYLGIP
jgi:hypothetical protein